MEFWADLAEELIRIKLIRIQSIIAPLFSGRVSRSNHYPIYVIASPPPFRGIVKMSNTILHNAIAVEYI